MALSVCKCLNVMLKSDKIQPNVNKDKLELTLAEQRDVFFSENLLLSDGELSNQISQPALVAKRLVGRWLLHSCLVCGLTTHAVLQDKASTVVIPQSTLTNAENLDKLKRSSNFSPIFNLLVPEVKMNFNMKENIDTSNINTGLRAPLPPQQALGSLNKQVSQSLQSQLEAVEEAISQFRDQKYAEYEQYREKAQRDHKILASIVNKGRENSDADGWRMDTSLDIAPLSPTLPPLQRRRLSSIKDAKKISNIKAVIPTFPPEEDSLDPEDIFDLEGTDSRHDVCSDQDDYDSDNSESHDEGIHIVRGRASSRHEIARSLPIKVPGFPIGVPTQRESEYHDVPSQDIAESIKALAKSVHGDAFDLPRPRFSTQI